MPVRLPILDLYKNEHTYCAYCPKLCRFSCPVSTAEGRETTTPWGKMTALHHVAGGALPADPAYAATWYACTGCERCTEFCAHGNEVSFALSDARGEAFRLGVAPKEANEVQAKHGAREARMVAEARTLFGEYAPPSNDFDVVYVPGCTAIVQAPESAVAGLEVAQALTAARARVKANRCCGLPLLDAGDREGFYKAADAFLRELPQEGTAIFQDPGCLHALRVVAREIWATETTALVHLTEVAATSLERFKSNSSELVRYHDACRLGRGLGVYEAPRKILTHITGQPPLEFAQNRAHSECSGAGGQLPRIYKNTSKLIAEERIAEHQRSTKAVLTTACPASARAFQRNGEENAVDLTVLMHKALA